MKIMLETIKGIAVFISMLLCAIAIDAALHATGNTEWGRYLGYWGSAFLLISFAYSIRKRKWIKQGKPAWLLRTHEFLAWLGPMLILVHGGIHFNALLPWLTMVAMLAAVASGLTGKYLLKRSRMAVESKHRELSARGLSGDEIDELLYHDALIVGMMQRWRVVHIPITATFAVLTLLHIVTVTVFWRW